MEQENTKDPAISYITICQITKINESADLEDELINQQGEVDPVILQTNNSIIYDVRAFC